MADDTYINEQAALHILITQGDYTESQARIILMHSLAKEIDGASYYPSRYIHQRAERRASR